MSESPSDMELMDNNSKVPLRKLEYLSSDLRQIPLTNWSETGAV
jgi:hypothetical protein